MDKLILLPQPRALSPGDGAYALGTGRRISLEGAAPDLLAGSGRRLQAALAQHAGVAWDLAASSLGPADGVGAVLRITPTASTYPEGYRLTITTGGILVEAPAPPGVFYGVCTLAQILQQRGRALPALEITDWPDFAVRGMMLDISRDKVPRMETLYALIDRLAGWKLNQVQLYTEHTFAYRQHPDVWVAASPVTGDEILALDAFCRERYIELVPNQNSFGHMERWLVHDRYAPLAETHDTFRTPWATMSGPFSLCPGDPGSIDLMRSLYDELLPHFSSRQFNVGCDETFDLGQGRSEAECAERGTERVYLDYLLKVHQEVTTRGHIMQFWGDIIVQRPELIPELPKDSVALEWGYDADHAFAEHCPQFAAAGIPFYVCPGTSSWCSISGRTENAIANLRSAAENGLQHGASGYLITDWGDRGHWQQLPISYLGFAAGSAFSWALTANRDLDLAAAISIHAFQDATGNMGQVAYDLGNVYLAPGGAVSNGTALFWVLQRSAAEAAQRTDLHPDFSAALAAVDAAMQPLAHAQLQSPDAVLVLAEYELTARLLRHACHRGRWLADAAAGSDTADTSRM
ncbi:MAG TPA: glycoside hydrolase family 20 zincin-like fold domain-containing protein, partial [Chloroflexia bacterium]|nr:glycoside hydrolase family 20 zincin-like fold domain-containing protein [Chloroflexia bacterium]